MKFSDIGDIGNILDNLEDTIDKSIRDTLDDNPLGDLYPNPLDGLFTKGDNVPIYKGYSLPEFVVEEDDPNKIWGTYDLPEFTVIAENPNKKVDPIDIKKLPEYIKDTFTLGKIDLPEPPPASWITGDIDREYQFDSRLPYYMATSNTNFELVDPMNKNFGVSVYKRSLLGTNPQYAEQQAAALKNNPNVYGTPAIMNPYAAIRLYGASKIATRNSRVVINKNYMIDRQRGRKFYDVTGSDYDETKTMASVPTTSNIIRWSTKDKWGRMPYRFQDFVFCKSWKQIENNRLITLRRYQIPTRDNLNFDDMYEDSSSPNQNTFAPMATMVTYFGGDSGNKLSSLLAFACGYNWTDASSEIFDVSLYNGNKGKGSANSFSGIVDGLIYGFNPSNEGGLTGNPFSSIYGTIVNLFMGDFGDVNGSRIYDRGDYPDPYKNGPWKNKIQGPVNSINQVKMRKIGLNFSQSSLNVTFSYVARPIGGINTKAVMLDILANALTMGYSSAVFWKGAHRFNIQPSLFKPRGFLAEINSALVKQEYDLAIDILCDEIVKLGGNNTVKDIIDAIKNIPDNIGNKFDAVKSAVGGVMDKAKEEFGFDRPQTPEESSSSILNTIGIDPKEVNAESVKNLTSTISSMGGGLVGTFLSGLMKYIFNMSGTIKYLQNYGPLLTGDPVGDWHLTIGNPFNPIATIGNLICENMKVEFSDELGPDDFPLEMKITYTLKHGMPRDSDSIQSMFNRGVGRIYTLPDWAKSSADYMTQVDKNIDQYEDGNNRQGWSQDVYQREGWVFDYGDENMNIRTGPGGAAAPVHMETRVPSNAGSERMNVPVYEPMNYGQILKLDNISDLSLASRGIFMIDDVSKYANLVNRI